MYTNDPIISLQVLLRGMTTMNMEVKYPTSYHNALHKTMTFNIDFCLHQALSLFDRPKSQTRPATEPSKEIVGNNPNAVVTILPPARE